VEKAIEAAVSCATRELTASAHQARQFRERQRFDGKRAPSRWALELVYWGADARLRGPPYIYAAPRVYGHASQRWRLAVRRAMIVRKATSACCLGRGNRFAAERVVGGLEASLAVDDEFESLMARWGQRRTLARAAPAQGPREGPQAVLQLSDVPAPGTRMPPSALRMSAAPRRTVTHALPPPPSQLAEQPALKGRASDDEVRCCVGMAMRRASSRLQARSSVLSVLTHASERASKREERKASMVQAANDLETDALLVGDEILAAKRRMEEAQARAEQRVGQVCTRIQAAERGRKVRKSLAASRGSTAAETAEEDASSAFKEIEASRQRMEAALLQAEQRVTQATTKIQAVSRGRRTRQDLAIRRSMLAAGAAHGSGDGSATSGAAAAGAEEEDAELTKAAIKIQAMSRGKKARQDLALQCAAQGSAARGGNGASGAASDPKVAAAGHGGGVGTCEASGQQLEEDEEKLTQAATKIQAMSRGRRTRQDLALQRSGQAQGGDSAPGVAADSEGAMAGDGSGGGEASGQQMEEDEEKLTQAATKIQAVSRGRKTRQDLALQRSAHAAEAAQGGGGADTAGKAAAGFGSGVGTCEVISEEGPKWAAIFERVARGQSGEQPSVAGFLDKGAFEVALCEAHPAVSSQQSSALWDGFIHGTESDRMDSETFCAIAGAVAAGSHAAAEFADISEEAFRALGAEGAPASSLAKEPGRQA